jgi:hypothetical protein
VVFCKSVGFRKLKEHAKNKKTCKEGLAETFLGTRKVGFEISSRVLRRRGVRETGYIFNDTTEINGTKVPDPGIQKI